ncbi:cerebellar degeneration-related protein 2-like isoform X2 [Agrilus planipennis]|uniref:Cerebellar degeneration-related protein 2-like isoform X2 n=1 Tax=Agrilus planipennis TaxID=224129 RepID=A0A7F5RN13_AGRPL|nr:cerebellar degeneration-related protein 2-like isoform X2 [Agrilus planipennis]XP_025837322.1 cerebellar degeneration-related protein 2-like isoform X2 [Agrilus planipennis]
MANFHDLQQDWFSLCQDPEYWTSSDLQLAAELGKTLLERNKELENCIKQQQNVIDDQAQEIQYLTKQTTALREVNDSRLRIYEQLEVSIQDLERANHRLALENASDKKQIKSLTSTIESLEARCEELQVNVDELKAQLDTYRLKTQRTGVSNNAEKGEKARPTCIRLGGDFGDDLSGSQGPVSPDSSSAVHTEKYTEHLDASSSPNPSRSLSASQNATQTTPSISGNETSAFEDNRRQIDELLIQLDESQKVLSYEKRRVTELEEQLATMVQRNQELEKNLVQLQQKDEEAKSMHDELNTLEEVRQGQLCSRCLRMIDSSRATDNLSFLDDELEDDDSSMMEALLSQSQNRSYTMDLQETAEKTSSPLRQGGPNLYRELVEKYEALLEVQRGQSTRSQKSTNSLSLHEEMQMSGDFSNIPKDTDEESGNGDSIKRNKKDEKTFSRTPTDFSEAETNSSGFLEETSNKATQTEGRVGSFLCTIADGDDCKFSIYDDASPIDSRFRNRPEYRELFKEIFTVLKKAAENKDEGEQLPLLDDHTPAHKVIPEVPPATPATENLPDFADNITDDTQSVLSSTMSEFSTSQIDVTVGEEVIEKSSPETAQTSENKENKPQERVLTPYMRQPLEYLSVGVNIRKRSSSKRKKQFTSERSDSPATPILGSPKITYSNRSSSRRRRDVRGNPTDTGSVWNGTTLHFYSRSVNSPTPQRSRAKEVTYENGFGFKPSAASQDLHKLKKLDLSYAEVLRNADVKKKEIVHKQRHK